MYVHPFVAGTICTILVEIFIFTLWAVSQIKKGGKQ